MTSTLILYKNCAINPNKLFIVDSLTDYLSSLTKITIDKFQYIRHGLRITVKINKSQDLLDFVSDNNYNYCSIQNKEIIEDDDDKLEKVCYYFIMKKTQLSPYTVELELDMDTINTFRPSTDFSIERQTTINRQHMDRYKKYNYQKNTITEIEYSGIYDQISELLTEDKYILVFNYPGSVNTEFGITQTSQEESLRVRILKHSTHEIVDTILDPCSYVVVNINDGTLTLRDYDYQVIEVLDMFEYYNRYNEECDFALEYIDDGQGSFDGGSSDNNFGNLMRGRLNIVTETKYYRNIDLQSEGLTPILYGTDKGTIQEDGQSWYLIYKGSNPLRCYICSDKSSSITLTNDSTIQATDLVTGRYYYLQAGRSLKIDGTTLFASQWDSSSFTTSQTVVVYWRDDTKIKAKIFYYVSGFGLPYAYEGQSNEYEDTSAEINGYSNPVGIRTLNTLTHDLGTIHNGSLEYITLTTATYAIKGFNQVDRTSSDLVKIIKLPYRPYEETLALKVDIAEKLPYLDDLSVPFEHTISTDIYNPFGDMTLTFPTITKKEFKSAYYESKLYHSDFFQPKFVYDSFAFVFTLERLNLDYFYPSSNFEFTFCTTNTINSRMLFVFTNYIDNGKSAEDYSNILYVARNNEVTILSSGFLDYLKMGYNYDVKTRNRQETGQWIGVGLSITGAIASFASSGVTGGFGVAGGITLATTALAQLTNAVNTTAQAEATQAQKLEQLRKQRTAVYGADDVDLMTKYTDNKAKFMLYQCSERMKNILYDLFFYTGYICGYRGFPNYTSRVWFNFVSCELVVSTASLKNISEAIMDDIKAKYSAGVTFLHKNVINDTDTWDFLQQYENWETSLL